MSLIFNVVFSFFLFMGMVIGSGKVTTPQILSENPSGLLQDLLPNDHAPMDVEGSFSAKDEDFLRKSNSAQIQSEICKASKIVACLLIPLGIFVVMGRKDWREQHQE